MNPLTPLIFIGTSAVSGDMQGGRLARELRRLKPDLRLMGSGGAHMAAAGVELCVETNHLASADLITSFLSYGKLRAALHAQMRAVREQRPDLAILIDCEGHFNERLSEFLHREGIPIVYYFPPLVWLWGRWRAQRIAQRAHAVIPGFPHEVSLYQEAGASMFYAGHPLVDLVHEGADTRPLVNDHPTIGLMPGSRTHEVELLARPMIEAAAQIRERFPAARFILPAASPHVREQLAREIARVGMENQIALTDPAAPEVLTQCDMVVVASGTATIELSLLCVPMLVVYRLGALTYQIARRVVTTPFIAMPNIVANRNIVPELRQADVRADTIATEVFRVLENADVAATMRAELRAVSQTLGEPGVLTRVSQFLLDELHEITTIQHRAISRGKSRAQGAAAPAAPTTATSRATNQGGRLRRAVGRLFNPVDVLLWQFVEHATTRHYSGRPSSWHLNYFGRFLCRSGRQHGLTAMRRFYGPDERSPHDLDRLWHDYERAVGVGTVEPLFLARSSCRLRRLIALEGEELLQAALSKGRGVMLLTSHLGPMGCLPPGLGARGYDITITGRALEFPYFEKKLRDMLALAPADRALIGENLPGRAKEVFARNGIFCSFVDWSLDHKHSVRVLFGQAFLLANRAGAVIALRHKTPVFFVRSERVSKTEFRVTLIPLNTDFAPDIEIRDRATMMVQQAIDLLAPDVSQRPDEWWPWFMTDLCTTQTGARVPAQYAEV